MTGVDLASPISDRDWAAIRAAWIDGGVLLMRDQRLTEEEHLAFARRFGRVKRYNTAGNEHARHPEILVFSNLVDGRCSGAPMSGQYWHTDGHFLPEPPSASILYALEVPPAGGDTWFANMIKAYDALSAEAKRSIAGRRAIISRSRANIHTSPDRGPLSDEERAAWPDVTHPMARTHPISGRKALYVGAGVPWAIEGMSEEDGASLMGTLQEFAIRPEFTWRHVWRVGDVLVWDNRSVIHKATSYDAVAYPRHLHRVTIEGEVPR
ncbi:MAG: TauD/TfdA family dioxygenase [Candidatus Eremiobacteraeota bacterium]|nr:TauD/TfdA family dioxygenase [Candidatus Eremiobacteraeota bacterium]